MILQIDATAPVPPYEQIRAQVTLMARSGVLTPGTRLPPIRQLAKDLGLASGTVARAYRELEAEGVVEARGRHGTTVAAPRPAGAVTPADRRRQLEQAAEQLAVDARQRGATLDELLEAVRTAFARTTRPDPGRPA